MRLCGRQWTVVESDGGRTEYECDGWRLTEEHRISEWFIFVLCPQHEVQINVRSRSCYGVRRKVRNALSRIDNMFGGG